MTQEELQTLCVQWQKTLRLQDWDVRLKLVRQREIPEKQGECAWLVSKKQATVKILDSIDYSPNLEWLQDQETTLVHELIHLHYAPIDHTEGLSEKILEQAVNSMALALVELKRAALPKSHER